LTVNTWPKKLPFEPKTLPLLPLLAVFAKRSAGLAAQPTRDAEPYPA
jgi:hypothetical protein